MPPRFVEVATPLEDSVAFFGRHGSTIYECARRFNHAALAKLEGINSLAPPLNAPLPTGAPALILASAVIAAALRIVYINLKTKRILRAHGQTRAFLKDL